jgi:DNA transformation protein
MPDDSFKEFVLDQLSALSDVRARAMFGAHGLYSGEHFFGILDEGRLFFKTDAQSEGEYLSRGMEPFTYEARGKVLTIGYHEVPPDILEQPLELALWARKAIAIAAAKSKKPARSSAKKITRGKKR